MKTEVKIFNKTDQPETFPALFTDEYENIYLMTERTITSSLVGTKLTNNDNHDLFIVGYYSKLWSEKSLRRLPVGTKVSFSFTNK